MSTVDCPGCNGTGDCAECDRRSSYCWACGGSGDCVECDGTGEVDEAAEPDA